MKRRVIVVTAIILVLAALSVRWWGARKPIDTVRETFQKTILYTLNVRNRSAELVKDIEMQSFAPVLNTPWQQTLEVKADGPYRLVSDPYGNQLIMTKLSVPPYGFESLIIESTLQLSSQAALFQEDQMQAALAATRYIESDNPAILATAKTLMRASVIETAKAIFDFSIKHVKPSNYIRETRGALYALKEQQGDCTEFAYLFVALARASGIPAQPIGGFIVQDRGRLKAEAYHNWAQFYDGESWHIVDPFYQNFDRDPEKYIAFRILGLDEGGFEETSQRFLTVDPRLEVSLD